MILSVLSIFIACFGFGIIFNIPRSKLAYAALGASIGALIYGMLMEQGVSEPFSLFLSSCGFTLYSELLARKLRTPVTTFIISALIALVPGKGMYNTMLEIINGNTMQAIETGLNTIACATALALGIVFVSTLAKAYYKYKK